MEARHLSVVLLAVAALAGCSGGAKHSETTDTADRTSTTEITTKGALDPCELLTPKEVADHSTAAVDAQVRVRGLSIKDPRVVECRLDSVAGDTANIGYVGVQPGKLADLIPNVADIKAPKGLTPNKQTRPLKGVGDEAYIAKDNFLWFVAARRGQTQLLLTLTEAPEGPARKQDAIALAKAAVARAPDHVELGTKSLASQCSKLDAATVAQAIGKVILARGSRDGKDGLVCDYVSSGLTRLRSDITRLEPLNIDSLVKAKRDDGFSEPLKGFPGAQVFYEPEGPSYYAYVDRRYDIELDLTAQTDGRDYKAGRKAPRAAAERLLRTLIAAARGLGSV